MKQARTAPLVKTIHPFGAARITSYNVCYTKLLRSRYHQDVLSSKESIVNIDGLWDDDLKNRWRWFVRDWETVYNHVDKEFPIDDEPLELFGEDNITGAVEAIEYFKTQPMIAVDIEATSLSPYRPESEILCIGFSNLKRNVGIV